MKKSMLLKLQFKRALKIYPTILLVTFLTLLAISTVAFFVVQNNNNGEDKQKINIAIVGDLESSYMEIGLYVLQNMDNSRIFVNFMQMEENQAKEALQNEEIAGYVHIPEGFVDGIYHGRNNKAKYIIKEGPVKISPMVSAEVLNIISGFVIETQNGNYSLQELYSKIGEKGKIRKHLENMTIDYVKFIIDRNKIYQLDLVGVSDLLSLSCYFVCGLMTFFFLIWGISCNRLLSGRNLTLGRMLRTAGVKITWQYFCEYLTFFSVTFITLQIIAIIFGSIGTKMGGFGINEFQTLDVLSCLAFVFKLIPVILMFTSMHMALYELFGNNVGGILIQFIIAVGLGYISGCFYPNFFFPESVQKFSEILPSGAGFLYIRKLMSGLISAKELFFPALYTLLFSIIAVAMRKRSMEVGVNE